MNTQQLITMLGLKPHEEGGYFCRTYQSDQTAAIGPHAGSRYLMTSIYYMLSKDHPVGYLHQNQSDIIHYYHSGSAIKYIVLYPDGKVEEKILGDKLEAGQSLQLVVKGGCWKASELISGEYGLISEAVAPGFEYSDRVIADDKMIRNNYPDDYSDIARYIKP